MRSTHKEGRRTFPLEVFECWSEREEENGKRLFLAHKTTAYIHTMTYYTTTLSSINYSQLTTLYHIENHNVTFHPINLTTTTSPLSGLPPLSPYSFTEKIIIGIIAVFLVLCTVIGNFMVSSCVILSLTIPNNNNSSHLPPQPSSYSRFLFIHTTHNGTRL